MPFSLERVTHGPNLKPTVASEAKLLNIVPKLYPVSVGSAMVLFRVNAITVESRDLRCERSVQLNSFFGIL
jgi:hypothetical protein